MEGFSESIFDNLDIEKLNRDEVMKGLSYIAFLINQEWSYGKVIKYQRIKNSLLKRLISLDKAAKSI